MLIVRNNKLNILALIFILFVYSAYSNPLNFLILSSKNLYNYKFKFNERKINNIFRSVKTPPYLILF